MPSFVEIVPVPSFNRRSTIGLGGVAACSQELENSRAASSRPLHRETLRKTEFHFDEYFVFMLLCLFVNLLSFTC